MSRRNLITVVVAAHVCVLTALALMGGCAHEKKQPVLTSAAPVQEMRAPEGQPESILEPKGMTEEKDLLVSREPELIPAGGETPEAAATPAPPTPVPFEAVRAASPQPAAEAEPERAQAPPREKAATAATGGTHTVAAGESLWKIARGHGVTVAELARANDLKPDARIRTGQTLVIPSRAAAEPALREEPALPAAPAEKTPAASAPAQAGPRIPAVPHEAAKPSPAAKAAPAVPPAAKRHVVQRGETLSVIARRYRVPLKRLAEANGIKDPGKIRAGMALTIPQ